MQVSKPSTDGRIGNRIDNTFENYQQQEYDKAISYVKQFRTGIDLGANVGVMSYRMVNDFKKVHSFEPLFFEHVAENVKANNIHIYPYAVGDKEDTAIMRVGIYHCGGSNIVEDKNPGQGYEEVKVVTLDSFNFTDVDFIKIDVEHYEFQALKGAYNTIKQYIPTILLELKTDNPHYSSIIAFLSKLGYKRKIVGELDSVFYQP